MDGKEQRIQLRGGAAEAVRAVCRAWEELDPQALADLFAADGIFDDPLKLERLVGPAAVVEGNRVVMGDLRSCRITPSHVAEDGDVGIAEGRFVAELVSGG